MKAIDRIFATVSRQFPSERVTTMQIADAVGLTRGVTSSYLSQLERQGKLNKIGSRPVYWEVNREKTAFDNLIGAKGSLRVCIQRAIEAIVFPNGGLPIFLTGPSGIGKYPFAQAIFKESVRRGVISDEAIFESVDCADFKDSLADLVREVQKKLSPVNASNNERTVCLYVENLQEVPDRDLRQFIYLSSRLDNENVRFIYSATADIFNHVKDWWKSAIVNISLRAYLDLPLNERLAYIAEYFQEQSDQLDRSISISPSCIRELADYDDANNLKALGNHIQLLCAQSYAQSVGEGPLVVGDLSEDNVLVTTNEQPLQSRIKDLITNMLNLSATVDTLIEKIVDSLERGENVTEQGFLVTKALGLIDTVASESLLNTTARLLMQAAQHTITEPYGVKLTDNNDYWRTVALCMVFADVCADNGMRVDDKHSFYQQTKSRYPRSSYLFSQFLSSISLKHEDSEYYWLTFFVMMSAYVDKIESVQYNSLIITHGQSTATSIQAVVNTLCGNYLFEAFDMPIDVSLDTINMYVQSYLEKQGASAKGTIVLFDMGSLSQMFSRIKGVSDRELVVVNNVNTAMALDVGLRVQRGDEFLSIANACEEYGLATNAQYYEGLSNKKNIIVSCMSGVGLSREFKRVIDMTLTPSIEVITLDYKKLYVMLENHNRKFFSNTQLILTTTDVEAVGLDSGVDIINAYNIFDKVYAQKMTNILLNAGENRESISALIDALVRLLSIEGIRDRLQILNPDVVIKESQNVVAHYEDFYGVKFESRLKLNLYMHLSLMIERMLTSRSGSVTTIDRNILTKKEKGFFDLSEGIFIPAEKRFNIKVQDYEIELLYQLLKDYI
ncbi:PRD domain-containing protein [Lacticaseibacillus hulanensis]|uniref:PRD domain-containing protein n=1 Tax=Lacticaseibacillus hulanensis TaxID=2493111 RepID=UPI000FDA4E06|nr:PRD domain-containing protein [Lacticaseibacillus hulanensis]